MLVRADRSRLRDLPLRRAAAVIAAFALGAARPNALSAQEPTTQIPATHTVKRGDTLWDIAKLYLGDPFLWPEIYRLNTGTIEDPHWIYPGEVLKLPGTTARVVAVTPPTVPEPTAAAPVVSEAPRPLTVAAPPVTVAPAPVQREFLAPVGVRIGEFAAAPWVDEHGGPRGSGYILEGRDLPGIATTDRSRLNLYDAVLVSPPVGSVAPEHELMLAYALGPNIEDFGQIVIPTGIIEITRSPRNGEAAIGRVVKMFTQMRADQRLIPYDSTPGMVSGYPSAITNGRSGKVRWISSMPVLPRIQNYVVVDISRRDVAIGDNIELYEPRQQRENTDLIIPEVWIANAQVLRVTPYGATAIITSMEQPKIEEGTAARVSAKMP
jgi:LysM domain-containing protein